jgi:serine/threonine protein kinase
MFIFSLHESVSHSLKYNRKAILGRGRYGTVFRGEWNYKRVAVKRIQIEDVQNNKGGEEALLELDHPNVVKLYHVDDSNLDFKY